MIFLMASFYRTIRYSFLGSALAIGISPDSVRAQDIEISVKAKLPATLGPIGYRIKLLCPPDLNLLFSYIEESLKEYEFDNDSFQASILEGNSDKLTFELAFMQGFVNARDTSWEIVEVQLTKTANRNPGAQFPGIFFDEKYRQLKPWLADGTAFREKYDAYYLNHTIEVSIDGFHFEGDKPRSRDDINEPLLIEENQEEARIAAEFLLDLILEAHSFRGVNYDILTGDRPFADRAVLTYEQICGIAN